MAEVVLGLDVGDARIGLARAEVGTGFAFGRGALKREGTRRDVDAIQQLARTEGATRIVVGLPRRTEDEDSPQTRRVRAFAKALEDAGMDVVLEDERFTTQLATRQLNHSALPRAKRRSKGRVDEASAVLILESFLARDGQGT